jgi:hypothetical protein
MNIIYKKALDSFFNKLLNYSTFDFDQSSEILNDFESTERENEKKKKTVKNSL